MSFACNHGNHEACQAVRLLYAAHKGRNFDERFGPKGRKSECEACSCGCHVYVPPKVSVWSTVPVRDYRPHGTVAGYRRHYRYGETPCDPCRGANAEAMKGYRSVHS